MKRSPYPPTATGFVWSNVISPERNDSKETCPDAIGRVLAMVMTMKVCVVAGRLQVVLK